MSLDAMGGEVRQDRRLVPVVDAEADMVDVAPLLAGRGAAHAAELAVDRHQGDERSADAQLVEADRLLMLFEDRAEHIAPEGSDRLEVDDAVDHMIDVANGDRRTGHDRSL